MTSTPSNQSLGSRVRAARLANGLSLRELARRLGKAPSYMNDIEYDRRVPSETVVRQLCEELDLDVDVMLAVAGRVGEGAEAYMRAEPTAGVLFRRVAEERLDEGALQELLARVEQLSKQRRPKRGRPRET
jgi:transcriptional regulator with XRE-family HTH domain